jgi:hypothetical protein
MKKFWGVFLKVATWGLGHQDVIKQVVADAKAKKIAAVEDGIEAAIESAKK